MKRSELIAEVAKETDCNVGVVEKVFNAITEEIIKVLKNKEDVKIHGFGNFVARQYKERKCYNPITGEIQMLPPSLQPAFIPGNRFREKINKK